MADDEEIILDEKKVDTGFNKCSSCGAEMSYDVDTGTMKCEHCGAEKKIEADDIVFRKSMADYMKGGKANWDRSVFRCNNCGAKGVREGKEINVFCPFCGSHSVVPTEELPGIKPDAIIPFKIKPEESHELFTAWAKKTLFAPRAFKQHSDIREHVNRLYMPSWAFTSNAYCEYRGTLGRTVQVQTRSSNGTMTTSYKTIYFNVSGQMFKNYTDYLVQSSDRVPSVTFKKLGFFAREKKPYRTEFIAGIPCEHYSRSLDTCFSEFSNFIKGDMRRDIMRRHNADTVQRLDIKLEFPTKEFNYLLLPLYIANYAYNNKTYNFFINGVNGKVIGKYPVSKIKVFFLSFTLAALAVVGMAAYWWFGR
ncbi:MAG: hydrogenase maturation nickel metallochaperone HypA [Christensenellaceae bacterium]|jgi:DNA-directed RNA polymerase subunit RPC12/RpoP|nr:hydrogenase maturation nickel metallochaperone HypA [Christensenellaceae bacterium]